MPLNSRRAAISIGLILAIIGVALLALGGSIQAGLTPLQVAGCGSPGPVNCYPPSVTASFKYTTCALTTTVTDTTRAVTSSPSIKIIWGDGSSTPNNLQGATVTHTYGSMGSYKITDNAVIRVTVSPAVYLGSNATLQVSVNNTGCTSGTGTGGSSGSGNTVIYYTCISPSTSTCASFPAIGFGMSAVGLTVTFTDHSALNNMQVQSDVWSFGDNITAPGTPQGVVNHTYAKSGNYTVRLTITASGVFYPYNLETLTKNASNAISVSPLGCVSGCTPPATPSLLNPIGIGVLVIGASLLISALPVGVWRVPVIVLGLIGGAATWAIITLVPGH